VLPALSRTFERRAELMSAGKKGSDWSAWLRQEQKRRASVISPASQPH
jgi:hypothetical protein